MGYTFAMEKEKDKDKGGRPTKYTTDKEMCAMVDEYLSECKDEEYQLTRTEGEKSTTYDNKIRVKLPTIEGFALWLGVHKDTLYEWKKLHQKFSDALDRIIQEQKERLINNGLSGDYQPVIAKLMLSSNHGMREKSDVTTGGEKIVQTLTDEDRELLEQLKKEEEKHDTKSRINTVDGAAGESTGGKKKSVDNRIAETKE